MNGFRVMGRVFVSGSVQTVRQWFWWQAARDLTGAKRSGSVVMRAFGTLLIIWFGGGTMWALGWLWYVLPAAWFVSVGVLAEVAVEDTEPLPSPTEEGYLEDEEPGQEVEVKRGRIGKAHVLRIPDPNNPARTHLVWLDPKTRKEAS